MSFYITVKSATISQKNQKHKEKISVVITSQNNRLFCSFVPNDAEPVWEDAFVAQSSQRQLQFMLIQQKVTGKSAKKLSSNHINLSKYLFSDKKQTDEISLQDNDGKETDKLKIQVVYCQGKNFIGPIEFYKKGSGDFDEDESVDLDIEGDNTRFPFWRRWFIGGDSDNGNMLDDLIEKDKVKFYKGAHKNRNIFSFCDQVYDDQKFTVVQNYYNDS